MAEKEIAVKKYVVRLSSEERQQLETLIRRGKGQTQRLLKARILLKADVAALAARIIRAHHRACDVWHGKIRAECTLKSSGDSAPKYRLSC